MRIEKQWASRLAAGVFLLCAAGLLWLLGAETVPRTQPAYLVPEAAPEDLVSYAEPLELSYNLPAPLGELRPVLEMLKTIMPPCLDKGDIIIYFTFSM